MLKSLAQLALAASAVSAGTLGFNYGAVDANGAPITKDQYEDLFSKAQNLENAKGFHSARMYTMIQGGTTDEPISAIEAALNTDSTLLLGLWASAGPEIFNNELSALKKAVQQYGSKLKGKIDGISVGSEDLYRDSIMGIQNDAGIGAGPDVIVDYIKQVREVLKDGHLSDVKVGHVDTWTGFYNESNSEVIANCDFLGWDGYPYWQNTMDNAISDAKGLFWDSIDKVKSVSNGVPIWITETGWPVKGEDSNLAHADVKSAKQFWDDVGCDIFSKFDGVWWYTMIEGVNGEVTPDFSIADSDGKPLFDLSCKKTNQNNKVSSSSSASSKAQSKTASSKAAQSTGDKTQTAATNAATGAMTTASGSNNSTGSSAVLSSSAVAGGNSTAVASGSSKATGSSSPAATESVKDNKDDAEADSTTDAAQSNGAAALTVGGLVGLSAVAMLL